jgi:hypothetical protein
MTDLGGRSFHSDEEVRMAFRKWFLMQDAISTAMELLKLVPKWDKCTIGIGDYVENDNTVVE